MILLPAKLWFQASRCFELVMMKGQTLEERRWVSFSKNSTF
jgi:hypothetical protein